MSFIKWNDYSNLSNMELERRIQYDLFLISQPGLHTMTHARIIHDRKSCEAELEKRKELGV